MESGAVVSSSCLTEESGEQAVLQCGPYTLLTGCGLMWSHVVSCGPDHLWMRSEWSDLSVSHSHLYWELSTCDHITQDRYWLQVRTGTVSLSVQMWGGAAVGVDRYRSLTSTPPSITAASIPPSPLPPSLHHRCLPYIKAVTKQSALIHTSGRESLPLRLQTVTVEMWLCHQRPISDWTDMKLCSSGGLEELCGLISCALYCLYFSLCTS